jgi:transcriptional regulator with XRE-family HTH domain
VADEIEVSQSTYSRIENGTTPIRIDTLQRIADVLDVDLNSLLSTTNIFHFNKTAHHCGYINNQTNNTIEVNVHQKSVCNLLIHLDQKQIRNSKSIPNVAKYYPKSNEKENDAF